MIGFLKGEVSSYFSDGFYLNVHGVGYEIFSSHHTIASLQQMGSLSMDSSKDSKDSPKDSPKEVMIWIYTHVREDLFQLYGFYEKQEKEVFLSLLKVNGVGPKLAMGMLSGARWEQLIEKIESEDVKGLTQLPKVGKKTAEQLVLTLKGKLVFYENRPSMKNNFSTNLRPEIYKDLSSALTNLGFRSQDVEKVLAQLPAEIDFQEGVKRGLAALSQVG